MYIILYTILYYAVPNGCFEPLCRLTIVSNDKTEWDTLGRRDIWFHDNLDARFNF